jgi:hypothetical protein
MNLIQSNTRAGDAINEVMGYVGGKPGCIVGSAVVDKYDNWHDLDIFVYSEPMLYVMVENLLIRGYTQEYRYERVWDFWMDDGVQQWHTNSMRLTSPMGVETNVVYKKEKKRGLRSLGEVLESFDFGLLARGYELETGEYHDARGFLFPGQDPECLPMMRNKQRKWVKGFISQYNGLREGMRYAKYHAYGHDMSRVKDDLVTGYMIAAQDKYNSDKEKHRLLAQIYLVIAEKISCDATDELIAAYDELDLNDELDSILEALT